jgi:hypothetical protein
MDDSEDQLEDSRTLQDALRAAGLECEVREETQALTASADGGAYAALAISIGVAGRGIAKGWNAYCIELARLLAQDTHSSIKDIFTRRRVDLKDEAFTAVIEPGLPAEAFELLANQSEAPSGELNWSWDEGCWKDSGDL